MAGFRRFEALDVPLGGTNLVEASAGTGKTYAITTQFVRLLVERGLPVDRILVVTFTEAATLELRERVRGRIRDAIAAFEARRRGEPYDDADLAALAQRSADPAAARRRLEVALRDVDLAAVHTIHAFCHRVLQDSAFESGVLFETEMLTDARLLRDEVVHDYWTVAVSSMPPALVSGMLDLGLDLARCRSLVEKAMRHPGAPILPEPGEAVPVPPPDAFHAAFVAARELWDEDEIRGLLLAPAMHKNLYRTKSVPGWCSEMSAFLAGSPDRPRLIESHAKFCTSVLAESTTGGRKPPVHAFFDACDRLRQAHEAFAEAARHRMVTFHRELVDYARQQLASRKEVAGMLTFDDLLQHLWNALRGEHGPSLARAVRRRFPAALIDEFQDTDPVQYGIFREIYRDDASSLFLVGDPKQAIYSFRGADVYAYMRAAAETDEERRYTMGFNWRSGPRLVEAVNCLFSRLPRPFYVREIGYPEVAPRPGARDLLEAPPPFGGPSLEVLFVQRRDGKFDRGWLHDHYPDVVAAEIAGLLGSGATVDGVPLAASDVAVLTRSNRQAFEIQRALRRARIPSVVLGDESVFESREADELQRVLSTVVEPTNANALRAALATELLGVTANEMAAMEEDDREWGRWVHDFRAWNELWSTRGFVQMFGSLMARRGVQTRLLALTDGERRMTNVLHLMELLHTASTTQHLGPTGLLHWLAQRRAAAAQRDRPEEAQIRLESDEKAVKITTVHRAKGLQYGVVYCPYVWGGMLLHTDDRKVLVFHDPDEDWRLGLEVVVGKAEESPWYQQACEESLAENLRLLYVALTRARHRCTMFWGAPWGFATSAPAYLLHAGAEAPDRGIGQLEDDLGGLSDERMLADLQALEQESEGRIGVRIVDPEARARPFEPDRRGAGELECRQPSREVERWWRTASFSQLASGSAALEPDPAEGRERDELAEADDLGAKAAGAGEAVTLAAFPRGARAGNFFHDVLEHLDFEDSERDRSALVERRLRAHGYPADALCEPVTRALGEVLAAPLPGADDLCLGRVPRSRRLDELEFHVPVAHPTSGGEASEHVTTRRLARVFREHPSPEVAADYAERVERLRFLRLHGFLKGYIDLVFEHDGRWFVVDYKSNHLGGRIEDYAPARLTAAMAHGHYYLQYHLYALAVHRFLSRRLAGYEYESAFGGVLYLFLRGMTPAHPGAGVFFERPPLARLEALSALLDGAGKGAGR